jgi:hypothetical protein
MSLGGIMEEVQWFLSDKHVRSGPITTAQVVHQFKDGRLDGLSLVWNASMTSWKPINEVSELKAAVQAQLSSEDVADDDDAVRTQTGTSTAVQNLAKLDSPAGGSQTAAVELTPATANYFYAAPGSSDQHGPIPADALPSLVAAGYIGPDTLVWCAGMPNWLPFKDTQTVPGVREGTIEAEAARSVKRKRAEREESKSRTNSKRPRVQRSWTESTWVTVKGSLIVPNRMQHLRMQKHSEDSWCRFASGCDYRRYSGKFQNCWYSQAGLRIQTASGGATAKHGFYYGAGDGLLPHAPFG